MMTDNLPAQPQAAEAKSQHGTLTGDGVAYTRHMEASYAEAAAYAHHLEQVVADYQQSASQVADYVRKLESELAKLREANAEPVQRSPTSADQEAINYTRGLEQTYTETVTYVHTLEKTVAEHQTLTARTADYISKLATELAKTQQALEDATVYAHSLADYVRRLEIKVGDLEENLRQYQET
jgi:uncharacterized coiled-coil protein SlyX